MAQTEQVAIFDCLTGETVERSMTAEEKANRKSINDELKFQANTRASALAKLADLGLTAEEIAAI